jgi:hypothetical protein
MSVKLGFSTLGRNIWLRAFADMALKRIFRESKRILEKVL